MGLDMWLIVKRPFQDKASKIISTEYSWDFYLRLKEELFYWRKANQFHKWFVENVQDFEDDCEEHEVSLEDLQKLLDTINNILGKSKREKILNSLGDGFDIELAKELLPTTEGFFFGGTEYDEYYLRDLKNTKKMLDKLFKSIKDYEGCTFFYRSSW